jgi:hypothetical protein
MSFAAEMLASIIEDMIQWGLEKVLDRYYSFYLGVVIDNVDDEDLDRLVFKIPSISDETWRALAYPKYQYASEQAGGRFLPDIGDHVWIEFERGDKRYPYWTSGVWDKPEKGDLDTPSDFQGNQSIRGFISKKGHGFYWDDGDKKERCIMRWSDGSGSKFSMVTMDTDGGVQIRDHKGNMLHLDPKNEKISLWDQHGNIYSSDEKGARILAKDGSFLDLAEDLMQLVSKKDVVVVGQAINLKGSGVAVGDGATDPIILGNKWLAYMVELVTLLISHTHASPAGPTSPTTVPLKPPDKTLLSLSNTVK